MSRNGSGSFSPPGASFPAVTGTVIDSSKYNSVVNDIGAEITNSIAADGQTVPTNNIQMGGHKITNLASGTVSGDALEFSQLATYAPLASPALTGIPTAPTQIGSTQDTSIATTLFVERKAGATNIGVGGGVDYIAGPSNSARQHLSLSGVLTANINFILPNIARWWIINDQTTGAFTITVKHATGTGITIPTTKGSILLYSDGTNIYDGFSLINNAQLNGIPTAATAAIGTNTTQLATTAFVQSATAKAWCNFDGTLAGTNAPRKGFNISSITRVSTGLYTINFTNPMADKNYTVSVCSSSDGVSVAMAYEEGTYTTPRSTSSFRITTVNNSFLVSDRTSISVIVFD
jgi:hypothetical protein